MCLTSSTILVIDDDTIVRDSIITYLTDCGFHVIEAASGDQGMAIFEQSSPDLILCDLRMPKMDGLAVLRSVRKKSHDVPFIVFSGAGVMADVVEALRLGASDFIIKPIVDPEVLEYAINRALENARLTLEHKHYRESLEQAIHRLEDHLNLLREDQKAGRQVQMKMLPQKPLDFQGYKVDHKVFPSLYLSGDFVDYFALNDHLFCFYLADVSGHGCSSAFITVLLKNMSTNLFNGYQAHGGTRRVKPSHVLSFINQSLLNTNLGKHVVVFGGVVDTREQTLTYAFGGHYPLPIMRTERETHFIEGKGLPVGLFEDATFKDVTINLPDYFSLTILSDGILEVLPQDTLEEKEDYLLSVVRDGVNSVSDLADKLCLNEFDETPDDVAMLILARERA